MSRFGRLLDVATLSGIGRVEATKLLISGTPGSSLSACFPFVSSLLLGGVIAFPQVVGGGNGDFMVAVVGWIVAMIVGYSYVVAIWVIYVLLKKVGLVTNEFVA